MSDFLTFRLTLNIIIIFKISILLNNLLWIMMYVINDWRYIYIKKGDILNARKMLHVLYTELIEINNDY